jgi:spore maturation protein CgeB
MAAAVSGSQNKIPVLRIFYASDTTPNAYFESNLWRNNLYLPLVDLGHEVLEFDYDLREVFKNLDPSKEDQKKFIEKSRPKISKALIEQIKKAHQEKPINIFFSYFYDACVFPEIIDEIKSMGIKTINWYCNASYQLDLVSQISPHYDICLVPEKFRIDDYKKLGANPIYCQEAANPNIYKPYNLKQEFDVTFVGQAYGERPDYVKYLLDNNIDIRVWGSGWSSFVKKFTRVVKRKLFPINSQEFYISPALLPKAIVGDILSDTEMIKMYSRSKINLGFSSCGNTHASKNRITQIRLRDFEVPMSGGFYMVEYMPELEEFFEIDKEIVCYHDKTDLVDKIKYYLKHDKIREKIRSAGRKRCSKDHTWHKRFESVTKQFSNL